MKQYCRLSAFFFGVVSCLHFVRLVQGWNFTIGPLDLPVWLSGVGVVVAAVLSATGMRLAGK
jgi:hypothetical protein